MGRPRPRPDPRRLARTKRSVKARARWLADLARDATAVCSSSRARMMSSTDGGPSPSVSGWAAPHVRSWPVPGVAEIDPNVRCSANMTVVPAADVNLYGARAAFNAKRPCGFPGRNVLSSGQIGPIIDPVGSATVRGRDPAVPITKIDRPQQVGERSANPAELVLLRQV